MGGKLNIRQVSIYNTKGSEMMCIYNIRQNHVIAGILLSEP
jgi:hypothetical protein